jgi:adenylylsulfate reductase, subunit A
LKSRNGRPDTKILLVDKAAMERSGAVAQGLSAINTYVGENSADDYVRMVRNDLMGIVREDLIFDLGLPCGRFRPSV